MDYISLVDIENKKMYDLGKITEAKTQADKGVADAAAAKGVADAAKTKIDTFMASAELGDKAVDTLKEIQKNELYAGPIVVLTANALTGMKEKYIELGFTDYLAKPIEKSELNRVLKTYLTKK